MYYLNVSLKVKDPHNVAKVAEALARAGALSKLEPGCDRWECYQSETDPMSYLLIERWVSKAFWEAHRQGDAVQKIYLKEVIPLVDREAHPSTRII